MKQCSCDIGYYENIHQYSNEERDDVYNDMYVLYDIDDRSRKDQQNMDDFKHKKLRLTDRNSDDSVNNLNIYKHTEQEKHQSIEQSSEMEGNDLDPAEPAYTMMPRNEITENIVWTSPNLTTTTPKEKTVKLYRRNHREKKVTKGLINLWLKREKRETGWAAEHRRKQTKEYIEWFNADGMFSYYYTYG